MHCLEIVYYTDPYCTWCWGFEPILQHIKERYRDQIKITYKMGGLVEDIDSFYDATNDIGSFEQVAPHWLEASSKHGMPVDVKVFDEIKDEMRSTYPANIAYKAAELQDKDLAEIYLRRLREAAAVQRMAIHREEVQIQLAESVGLETERFSAALKSGRAKEAFEADLHEARSRGISGFPTFVVKNTSGDQLTVYGYRPFSYFVQVFNQLAGRPLEVFEPADIVDFVTRNRHVATREVAEVFDLSQPIAKAELAELEKKKRLKKVALGNGEFWEPTDLN